MTSSHADNLGTTIYDEVDYKVMSDVPYELDQHVLVQMQKLERGLSYILDNLRNSDMTLEEVAAHAGYSPGYFKALFVQHFEIPFERFVTKLRMRQAARDICDEHFPLDIAARYGYATPASFSKAFRREIGVSPRQFYKGNYAVPDMPLRSSLDGVSIDLDYTVERAFILCGNTAPPPRGDQTFLMDELALPFTGECPQFEGAESKVRAGREDYVGNGGAGSEGAGSRGAGREDRDAPEGFVGLWHYRAETGMEYVFGPVEERLDAISVLDTEPRENADGTLCIVVQGGRYAVFSYERPEDDRAIPLMQRMLSRYVFQEWIPVNRKATNTMGYTYERFTSERVYLYLPIAYGMDYGSELRKLQWGVEEWASHIDELIDVDLNAEVLANLEGYSAKNYIDVFSMYYGLTPSVYIRRRRLYLAEEQLRQAVEEAAGAAEAAGTAGAAGVAVERLDAIVRKYRFTSYEQFLRMREKEFGDADARNRQKPEYRAHATFDQVARPLEAGARTGLPREVMMPVADDDPADGRLVDLRAFYEFNKERVAFFICRLRSFGLLEYSIEESRERRQPQDLSARVLYWFTRPFPGAERFAPYFASDEAKVFIWAQAVSESDENPGEGSGVARKQADSGRAASAVDGSLRADTADGTTSAGTAGAGGTPISRYYVAYVLKEGLTPENRAALEGALASSGACLETVPGGCYAVFSTVDDLESYSLHDAFRLLTRCAFGGWIKDNRWRVDFSRRTFVVWRDSKLYFVVPTVG